MKLLQLIKDIITAPEIKKKTNSEHENFMKLMEWGCNNDRCEKYL